MNHNFKKYILFWLSGSVSQLGSAMTSYALILWSYTRTGSAMAVSLMSFFHYLPYIAVSVFAGGFVDRKSKKGIMLVSDSLAAFCSLAVLLLSLDGSLQMWHIYLVNMCVGLMNAFQSPAQSIAVGMLVPKEKLGQASGMDSFSANLVTVVAPVFASALFALGGLESVIALDLVSGEFQRPASVHPSAGSADRRKCERHGERVGGGDTGRKRDSARGACRRGGGLSLPARKEGASVHHAHHGSVEFFLPADL